MTPNMFTFFGLAVNSWAAALFRLWAIPQAAAALLLRRFWIWRMGRWRDAWAALRLSALFSIQLSTAIPTRALYGAGGVLHVDRSDVLHDARGRGDGELVHGELFASARRIADPVVQSGLYGAAGAPGAADYGRGCSTAWRRCSG